MRSDRRGRRVNARPTQAQPDPCLPKAVIRQYGNTWSVQAWHARVWSFVLTEIPTQLFEYERDMRAPFEQRLRELRQYGFDTSDEAVGIEATLGRKLCPDAEIAASGMMASIFREVGEWPRQYTIRVDFALNGGGEMAIRCQRVPDGKRPLPPVLIGPHTDRNAQEEAARLVRAAIRLVAEELPPPPARPPYAA